ncbi:MAG: hypothetical protein HDT38_00515 [Clostridiales bacterium]|nr:hypothetical protein [Clostridiales bacterium]
MASLRTKIRDSSRAWLPVALAVYILCQPLLDVFTGLAVQAGIPVTVGIIVRSLFMGLAFLYAVFISDFPGKKQWMAFIGALVLYLALFMAYMFSLGGLSLCVSNLRDVVKTFFAPLMLFFFWAVYREFGLLISVRAIAWAGALYASVIPISYITNTSFLSYANSGYGVGGWFYAANEVGCILAITGPFTILHCLRVLPTVTKETWWKGALAVWALAAVSISANFLGTKIIFGFTTLYCAAAFLWTLWAMRRDPGRARRLQAIVMGCTLLLTVVIFLINSPLKRYLNEVYFPLLDNEPEITTASWNEELRAACRGTWLYEFIESNELMERIDQILSRRFISASPAIQVYTDGGIVAKLLGIGYANVTSYSRDVHYMIEMDPPSILVRHGILGFVLYYVPYLAFIVWSVVQFFKRPAQRLSSLPCCTALYCTLAGCAISALAGHALVAPAVAIFILVVGLQFWDLNHEQNQLPKPTGKIPPVL